MQIMRISLFLLALLVPVLSSSAQSVESQTRSIDAYVRSVDKQRKKTADLIFADVADYGSEASKWLRFRSEAALEKHRKTSETYTIAYIWTRNGKVVNSNFTHFSPSGDWTEYVYCYYRPDGTLSRADVDFRTFYGDLMILQKLYFDADGRKIKGTKRTLDLMTKKPKKAGADFDSKTDLAYGELYKTTASLPFASLIK